MSQSRRVSATSTDTFDTQVLGSPRPVVVDFWASWCGPCLRLAPLVDELAEEMSGIEFVKVNVDDEPELAQRFGVTSIPTLKLFRQGELVGSQVGASGKAQLRQTIERVFDLPVAV